MLDFSPEQQTEISVFQSSSVSIILVADANRQVIDAQISSLEACEIMWLLSLVKKHGFAAVEETLVNYLLAKDDYDQTF